VIGHATNIITGLAVSLQDAVLPVTVITAGMWIAYSVAGGLYGVTLAATAMLSAVMLCMAAIVVAVGSYGPITHNGGIAECPGHLPHRHEQRRRHHGGDV
jgi:K(+)-stimulated pyrophosphate-energized sodium pump